MQERIAAIRVFAEDIVKGAFDKEDGARVVSPYGVEIRRSVVIGHVVRKMISKKEREFASITIDDGTETIRAKAWDSDPQKLELLKQAQQDTLVLVVGRVRQIGDEVYIDPEIVRELPDPNYMTLHRLERLRSIIKLSGAALDESKTGEVRPTADTTPAPRPVSPAKQEEPVEPKQKKGSKSKGERSPQSAVLGPHERVLTFIRENAGDQGVSMQQIAKYFKSSGSASDLDLLVIDLLGKHKIREVRVGVYIPAD